LFLWKWEASIEVGEERVVTYDVEAAGGNVCHVVVLASNGSNREWASLDGALHGCKAAQESARSGGLRMIRHAFGPCHGGRVIRPNAGSDVFQIDFLLKDHVVE
jgi:hypothetical protein